MHRLHPEGSVPRRAIARPCLTAVAAVLLSAPLAHAATTRSGEQVIVEAHEVIDDDLVAWGSYVRIDGIVRGDVVALGADVVVEGVVEGDLVAAGKTVHLNGTVGDDARIGAFAIALGDEARVVDDAFVLGYSLETKSGSRIAGTAYAAVRQALLAGQITESLELRAGAFELAGMIGGGVAAVVGGIEGFAHSSLVMDLAIEIPEVPEGVSLTETARIGGALDYRAETEAHIAPGALIVGETHREPWALGQATLPTFDEPEREPALVSDALERFALLALLGLALAAVAPQWMHARGQAVGSAPARAIGSGLLAGVTAFAASFVLGSLWFVSVAMLAANGGGVAESLAIATTCLQAALLSLLLVAVLYLAPALASLGIGDKLLGAFTSNTFAPDTLAPNRDRPEGVRSGAVAARLLVGSAIFSALSAVPRVGPLVVVFGALAGLGALALGLRSSMTRAPRS